MISKKEVEHIAKLARIGLDAKELEKYRKDLSSILDYVDQLQEVDVANVEPTTNSVRIASVMRQDVALPEDKARVGKLVHEAPDREGGYIKVPLILKYEDDGF